MDPSRFYLSIGAIALALMLSATPGVGAMIGLFFAFGVAFFVAGPCFMVAGLLRGTGLPITDKHVLWLLVLLYAGLVLGLGRMTWRAWDGGDLRRARLHGAKALLFATLPMMGLLSVQALADAWR